MLSIMFDTSGLKWEYGEKTPSFYSKAQIEQKIKVHKLWPEGGRFSFFPC